MIVTVSIAETMKNSKKYGAADDNKEGGGSGRCYICGSEQHFAHRHCGLCKGLEHRTRDCEERGGKQWRNAGITDCAGGS